MGMAKEKTAILVMGMHRSGTSALARALNMFGADMGDANLFAPHATDNPTGYWEHKEILELNDRILAAYETNYLVRTDLPCDWIEGKEISAFSEELNLLLGKLFESKWLVMLKDPRLCFLAPVYFQALHDLGFRCVAIHPLRPPAEVAASLYKRHSGGSLLEYEVNWARTVLAAEAASRTYPRIFTTYEMLLKDPASIYDTARQWLQIDWPISKEKAQEKLGTFLDSALYRNRSLAASNFAPIEALYNRMFELASRETKPDDLRYFDQWPEKYLFLYPLVEHSRAESEVLRGEVQSAGAALCQGEARIAELEKQVAAHLADREELEKTVAHLRHQVAQLSLDAAMIRASASWKLTAPVRFILNSCRSMIPRTNKP